MRDDRVVNGEGKKMCVGGDVAAAPLRVGIRPVETTPSMDRDAAQEICGHTRGRGDVHLLALALKGLDNGTEAVRLSCPGSTRKEDIGP